MTSSHAIRAVLLLCALCCGVSAQAARIAAQVTDSDGAPLADAVVSAVPLSAPAPAHPKPDAAIEQIDKQFVPLVTVIQTGTAVNFPNRDPIRHHVYSFSAPKVFEIKLYSGVPAKPMLFDKPGEVVLGCNIHDGMVGYVYIVDTPFFGKTDRQGRIVLDNLPAGDYEVRALHYRAAAPSSSPRPVRLRGEETAETKFAVTLRQGPAAPGR